MYTYLTVDGHVDKGMCNQERYQSQDYKDRLENKIIKFKSQQRFSNKLYNIFTEKVNMIALSVNDDKRIQTRGGMSIWYRSKDSKQR